MQLSLLSDLTRHLSCEDEPDTLDRGETYYKLRFEAAEARYGRMKALVRVSLQKQSEMQNELLLARLSNLMTELSVSGPDGATALWNALSELKEARAEIRKLTEMNRCLQRDVRMEAPSLRIVRDPELEGALQAARQQISAMDLELVRMNDQQFEIEERLRESQDVIDRLLNIEHTATEPVHPRFFPMNACPVAACQNYTKRLRNGLRQAVADAYVRDRRVRLHGHFQQTVRPLEERCAIKDEHIRDLRLRLARLECATLRSADDVSTVSEEKAAMVAEVERLRSEADVVRAECEALQARRGELLAEIRGLQDEVAEAKELIDECNEKRSLCTAELQCLENERERAEQAWGRVQGFMNGQMAADYDRMQREYQRLEHELGVAQAMRNEEKPKDEEDKASVKRVKGVIFIACKCGESVPANEINKHILHAHSTGAVPCPRGCGFYGKDDAEMRAHACGKECSERTEAIKRLKSSTKRV